MRRREEGRRQKMREDEGKRLHEKKWQRRRGEKRGEAEGERGRSRGMKGRKRGQEDVRGEKDVSPLNTSVREDPDQRLQFPCALIPAVLPVLLFIRG